MPPRVHPWPPSSHTRTKARKPSTSPASCPDPRPPLRPHDVDAQVQRLLRRRAGSSPPTCAATAPRRSSPASRPLSTFAEDIAALLDDLDVDATSSSPACRWAARSPWSATAQYPDRIRGLILADTFPAAETPAGKKSRNDMADRLLREGMRGYADEVLHKMVAPYADAEVAAHVHGMMTATPPPGRGGGPARAGGTPRLPRPAHPGHGPVPGRGRRGRRVHPGLGREGDAREPSPTPRSTSFRGRPTCRTWNDRGSSTRR